MVPDKLFLLTVTKRGKENLKKKKKKGGEGGQRGGEEKSVFVQAAPAPCDCLPATEAKRFADLLRCAGTQLCGRAGTAAGAAGKGKEHKSMFPWQIQTPHSQPLFGQSYHSERYLARAR